MEKVRAIYEKKVLKPMKELPLREGQEVDIIIVLPFSHFRGILKDIKIDSVTLQHKIKEYWREKYGSS
ncbi:MAG: antitoxin family protein [candidate division WOR-3 bacterium]